ncbi:hypothetical protein BT93_J1423 [Corymbia citriodora subsp. variegata]|nr:hypothetical protein BT93_J1423 [Corymbia citriodora subsp. variegata]
MPIMMAADLHRAQLLLPPSSSSSSSVSSLIFAPEARSLSSAESDGGSYGNHRRSGSSSPSMSGSGLTTPSGSEVAGSEVATESSYEDDGYMAELTRQMAQRMLQEDDDDINHSVLSPAWGLAGSPPSTLWSPFAAKQSGKKASFPESDRAWDISLDLSEQFEKMVSFDEQEPQNHNFHQNFYDPAALDSTSLAHPSSQALSTAEIMASEFDRVLPERVAKESGPKNRKKRGGNGGTATAASIAKAAPSPSTMTHRQAQRQVFRREGSAGMRAVFLGGSGSGNGSSGTGVFLPRGAGNEPPESRKKTKCSTVLIPARVAHALMAHYDKMGTQSRPGIGSFPPKHDAARIGRSTGPCIQQKHQSEAAAPVPNQGDIDLPQEWMY